MESSVRWTWADLVSSYRFWGLIIFSFSIVSFKYFIASYLPVYIRHTYGYEFSEIGVILLSSNFYIVTVLSIIPAWIASREKSYYFLQLYASVIIIALLITYYYIDNLMIISITIFIIGILGSAISLLISAILAKAVDSVEFFVLSFGLVLFSNFISNFSSPISASLIMERTGDIHPIFFNLIIQVIIGMLFLLPVRKTLFNEAPPIRKTPCIKKDQHSLMNLFLLSVFIPFYIIYWCVRAHRDIRNYSQSARLLTPKAAGWCSALVPFAIPVMLINLTDVTDEYLLQKKRSRWALILLSFFFLPIAIVIVQSYLNQLSDNVQPSV
ncbi:hypothetical protein [Orbus mooreae]|uniref:hypothetical protein n=1 Tax=Orbus mooreae TaxID=3074107 RepID=UPI00370DC07C